MNSHDDLDTRIGAELDRRVAGLDAAPHSFDDIVGRARSIQRRRAGLVAGAAAAAILAAVVPVSLLVGGDPDSAPVPPATGPTVVDTANPVPPPTVGDRRKASYFRDGTLIRPGGGPRIEVPKPAELVSFVDLANGDLVLRRNTQDGDVLEVRSADGTLARPPYTAYSGLVVNPQGTAVAWVTPQHQVAVHGPDGTVTLPQRIPGDRPTVASLSGDCLDSADDCVVHVNSFLLSNNTDVTWAVSDHGTDPEQVSEPLTSITDSAPDGRLIGTPDAVGAGVCYAMTDPEQTELAWQTCKHRLTAFSTDADHVAAMPPGETSEWMAVLDSTGTEVLRHEPGSGNSIWSVVWDDESHLLVQDMIGAGKSWRLLRLGLDGSEEVIAEVDGEGRDGRTPYLLPLR